MFAGTLISWFFYDIFFTSIFCILLLVFGFWFWNQSCAVRWVLSDLRIKYMCRDSKSWVFDDFVILRFHKFSYFAILTDQNVFTPIYTWLRLKPRKFTRGCYFWINSTGCQENIYRLTFGRFFAKSWSIIFSWRFCVFFFFHDFSTFGGK